MRFTSDFSAQNEVEDAAVAFLVLGLHQTPHS